MNTESELIQGPESGKALKPYVCIDDMWETGIARHVVDKMGGNGDETSRVHVHVDETTGKACITSFGKPEVLEKLDHAFKVGKFEHRMYKIKKYPSDAGFPFEAIQKVMRPYLFRTIQCWRQDAELPKPFFEEDAIKLEKAFEKSIAIFGGDNSSK